MGKSYGVIEWAETTGNPLTVFTSRRELYGQYTQWCEEMGLSFLSLPAFQHDCETMGEDLPLEEQVNEVYESGISGAEIHENARQYFGRPLPCQQQGKCRYMERREFDPENYDVLIGHYLQAHNRDYLEDRYVAIDEFPGDAYFFEPTHNDATRAISNYLDAEDALPFENWKDLIRRRNNSEYEDEVREWVSDLGFYSHRDTRLLLQRKPGFHAHAPLLTHAGLEFDLLDNEWETATLGAGRRAVRSPEDEWTVLIPPPLYASESVIALDGTPTVTKWRLALGGDWIEHEKVLESDTEKREYLRNVLGLEIKQTDAGSKPHQSGKHINTKSDGALLEGIYEREGTHPAVITSKQAQEQYDSSMVHQFIEGAEHYGNLKGSNKFAETRVGAVIGSPHPPENEAVKRWGALDGRAVERKERNDGQPTRGEGLEFQWPGNKLFQDVVEKEVLQAVMRFGRTPSKGEKGATVYVHTSRLPEWVTPDEALEVDTWSDGMEEVVNALRRSESWPDGELTNKEIAADTSVGTKQVGELMKELDEEGYVTHRRGGRGNAYHWSDVRLAEFTEFGQVE
ncbi:hypothetical protein [Haloplanus rubicundus]|uniref:Uncharacterized protein n=1 Tax=Haloplanus rubicundus TaxID=1547898 RepID=A0A345EF85_9EURY|nr:hypothetical protein [Haloplanus rubicundus]AXG10857.1 hypothetical protein DU484_13945 [Haloplanus rubicundus]